MEKRIASLDYKLISDLKAELLQKISKHENQTLEFYKAELENAYDLIFYQMETILALSEQVATQNERIKLLESRLNMNSKNSNKPPSTDEFIKPVSLRKKSSKRPGGQKGHKGSTLKMSKTPDEIIIHEVKACHKCGHSLEGIESNSVVKRQVFDIPPPRIHVIEHQTQIKDCPSCAFRSKASFPINVTQPTQYGDNFKSMIVYLNQYQMIPYKRIIELVKDLYETSLSEGTVFNFTKDVYKSLKTSEDEIIERLISAPVKHADETGLRIEGKRQWLHVVSTDKLTHYGCHPKRGKKATDDIGILPKVEGIVMHDYWRSYFKNNFNHALCNVHHLRELTGIKDLTGQDWPEEMIELLLEIKELVDKRKIEGASELDPETVALFNHKYATLVKKGYAANPPPKEEVVKKRGRKKQSKARNMLDRLDKHQSEVLAFMHDFRVPFDNNLAERDIRMVKVKQKISGVFRSSEGAKMFCRIRGYISTVRKRSLPILDSIQDALAGNSFLLKSND